MVQPQAMGVIGGQLLVMHDADDGGAGHGVENRLVEERRIVRIERARRLVDDQQGRALQQDTRQRDPLLLAGRQFVLPHAQLVHMVDMRVQTDLFEQRRDGRIVMLLGQIGETDRTL